MSSNKNNSNIPNNNDVCSVYIPKIYKGCGTEKIRTKFLEEKIGNVIRVDFVPIKPQTNDLKNHSAFVYFIKLQIEEESISVMQTIETCGGYRIYLDSTSDPDFWLLLKNKAPFQDTALNIHQLSHNMELIEDKFEKLCEKLVYTEERIYKLEQHNQLLIEENFSLTKQVNNLSATFNNISQTLEDMYSETSENENKIERLQISASKIIENIYGKNEIIPLINNMKYGIPYAKRLLTGNNDYGDSDNEEIDNLGKNNLSLSTTLPIKKQDNRKKKVLNVMLISDISHSKCPYTCEMCNKNQFESKIYTLIDTIYIFENEIGQYPYIFCSDDCRLNFENNSEKMYISMF